MRIFIITQTNPMKALVVVSADSTEFFIYENDDIFSHYKKLCRLQGGEYLDCVEEFDDLMEIYVPLGTYKIFQGSGVYDYEGTKHPVLTDEGGTIYYIVENYSQMTDKVHTCFLKAKQMKRKKSLTVFRGCMGMADRFELSEDK